MSNDEMNKKIGQLEDKINAKFDEISKEVDKFIEENATKLKEISEQLNGKHDEK